MTPPVVEAGRVLAGTLIVAPSLLTKRTLFFGKLRWPKKKAEVVEPSKDPMKEPPKKPIETSSSIRCGTKQKPATPCDVSFFKVDPKRVNSFDISKVSVVKGGYNQHERLIHSFLNTHYWPREPCVLGLWVPTCSSYLQGETKRLISSGDRWLAFESNGEERSLIGVLVAQKTYPWLADELEWTAQYNCFRPEQKHLYFRAHTLRSSNLFKKYSVPYIYHIEVLATDGTKYRSDSIAELLLRTSIMHALEMRHPITMIVAKSRKEADICEKMGMYWEWSMNDDEYIDPTGKRMFFPRLPNQTLNIYIRNMEIKGSISDDIYSPVYIREIYEDPEDTFEEQEQLIIPDSKKSVLTTDNPITCDSKMTEAKKNSNHYESKSLGLQISEMSGMHSIPKSNIEQHFNIKSDKTETCIHKSFDTRIISILDDLKAVIADSTTCDTKTPIINDSKSCHTKTSLVNDSTSLDNKTPMINDSTTCDTKTPIINDSKSCHTKISLVNDSTSLDIKTPMINVSATCDTKTPIIDDSKSCHTKTSLVNDSTSLDNKTPMINVSATCDTKTPIIDDSKSCHTKTSLVNDSTSLDNKTPMINVSATCDTKTPIIDDSKSCHTKTSLVNDSTSLDNKTPMINVSATCDTKTHIIDDSKSCHTKTSLVNDSTSLDNKTPMINDATSFDTQTNLNNSIPGNIKTLVINGQTYYYKETPDYSTFFDNTTPMRNDLTSWDTKTPYINDSTPGDTKAPEINNKTYYYHEAPVIDYSTFLDTKTTLNDSTPRNSETLKANGHKFYYTEAPVTDYSIFLDNKTPEMNDSTSLYNKTYITNESTHLNSKTPFVNDSTTGNTKAMELKGQKYDYNKVPLTEYLTFLDNETPLGNELKPGNTKTTETNGQTYNYNEPPDNSTFLDNKIPLSNHSTSLDTKTRGDTNAPIIDKKKWYYYNAASYDTKKSNHSTSLDTKTRGNTNAPEINNKTYHYNAAPYDTKNSNTAPCDHIAGDNQHALSTKKTH